MHYFCFAAIIDTYFLFLKKEKVFFFLLNEIRDHLQIELNLPATDRENPPKNPHLFYSCEIHTTTTLSSKPATFSLFPNLNFSLNLNQILPRFGSRETAIKP